MKISKIVIVCIVLTGSVVVYSQKEPSSLFKSDLNKSDVKTVLKAVADWQLRTPLTHDLADWTNGALYTGMVEWAGIADDNSYFEWLKNLCEKTGWSHINRDNPLGRYLADAYC